MGPIPPIDWNGNGRLDPEELALFLAMNDEEEEETDEDGEA